jgi:hypothetical protein
MPALRRWFRLGLPYRQVLCDVPADSEQGTAAPRHSEAAGEAEGDSMKRRTLDALRNLAELPGTEAEGVQPLFGGNRQEELFS